MYDIIGENNSSFFMPTTTLKVGDAIELSKEIKNNSINVTVTSPPYNKAKVGSSKNSLDKKYIPGVSTNGVFKKVEYDSFDDSLPEEDYQQKQIELLNIIHTKTVEGGSLFYNHKIRYNKGHSITPWEWLLKTNWHIREEIIWARGGAVEISGFRFIQNDERIYWLCKGSKHPKLPRACANLGSIWKFGAEMKNDHPAPYPLLLPVRCIEAVLSTPGVVLDPYNGSGTTGVAAKLLGHNYIGFDLSENYLEKARDRITNISPRDLKKFRESSVLGNSGSGEVTLENFYRR